MKGNIKNAEYVYPSRLSPCQKVQPSSHLPSQFLPSFLNPYSLFYILLFPPYFCRINLSLTHRKIHLLQLTNYMRRIVLTVLAFCAVQLVFAQDTTVVRKTVTPVSPNVGGNDHLLLQLGYTQWQGKPDSIKTKGLSRTFNMYFMF